MIYLIVPAYNEAENLPDLLAALTRWSQDCHEQCHVIVVDDGSTDGTENILEGFKGLPLTVVRHSPNRGVAKAFESGFGAWAAKTVEPLDLVVTLEADNTSSLEFLDTMVRRARSGYDVVLASCYAPGGEVVGTNRLRTVLSFCANLILRCTPGMPKVYTFSSFYRVYRGPFLRHVLAAYGERMIQEAGFVCVVEMLLKFGACGARICEVPFRLDGSFRKGASKMLVRRTILGYLRFFLRATVGLVAQPQVELAAQHSRLVDKGIDARRGLSQPAVTTEVQAGGD